MVHPAMGVLVLLLSGAGAARAESCDDLWYARNEIYKGGGYCFHTSRGIQAFGNAGCQFDNVNDVPLSEEQRLVVADIVRQERLRGCN